MRDFLRHLKAAWRYGLSFPYSEQSDAPDFWGAEDAEETARFFNSRAGRKLSVRLRNYAIKLAEAAVQNPVCSPYQNGQASGARLTFAAIEAHYPQEKEEPEQETALEQLEAAAI